jgi:hypothetical protein
MKVVNDDNKSTVAPAAKLPPGIVRLYNKIDGSTVDVHAVDGREYIKRLPHLWSNTPIAKEQAKAEDAVIVQEPVKEEIKPVAPEVVVEPAPIVEEKPVSARSRKLAKLED